LREAFYEENSKNALSSLRSLESSPVNKVVVEQNSPEPKVKVFIPMYEPLQVSKCEKCGKTIAQPKELIEIVKKS
jgi:hypothetical protein